MAEQSDTPKLELSGIEGKYTYGEDVSFDVAFLDYKWLEGDYIMLVSYIDEDEEREIARQFVADAAKECQEEKLTIIFDADLFSSSQERKFRFKYVSGNSGVVAESDIFETEHGTIYEEKFVKVDSAESYNDSVRSDKASNGILSRLEEECRKLKDELKEIHRKSEDYEACCKVLQAEKSQVQDEFDEEKRQREKSEVMLQELECSLLDKMQCIDEQNRQIEELERCIRMETRLHNALKEEFEGQSFSNEECLMENEQLKMRLTEYRKDYVQLNKMNEEERDLYRKEFSRHESEITHMRRLYEQKIDDVEDKLAEAQQQIKELEDKFVSEKMRSAGFENQFQELSKDFGEQLELKEFELAEAKKEFEEIQEILSAERDAKTKIVRDYDSAIEELEQRYNSEIKKVNFLTSKCEEMQQQANKAEGNAADLKMRLEEADNKLVEMEDLIKSSKSELEILKKTVSAPEARLEEHEPSPKRDKSSRDKLATKSSSKSTTKAKEYTVHDSKWNWSREKEKAPESNVGKSKNSGTKIVYSYSESKRGGSRYANRRRSSLQEDENYRDKSTSYGRSSDRRDRQTGLIRQHRNALLRENSRLRYSMTMLNHDCAILNYTLQQVVSEAEQKLESLYTLYARKESECASYEAMFATGNMGYNPYSMPGDYVETYYQDGSYPDNGMIAVNYGYYGEPYYGAYGEQDAMVQMSMVPDQGCYQQAQYAQQIYVPTQQVYCGEQFQQPIQYDVAAIQG